MREVHRAREPTNCGIHPQGHPNIPIPTPTLDHQPVYSRTCHSSIFISQQQTLNLSQFYIYSRTCHSSRFISQQQTLNLSQFYIYFELVTVLDLFLNNKPSTCHSSKSILNLSQFYIHFSTTNPELVTVLHLFLNNQYTITGPGLLALHNLIN